MLKIPRIPHSWQTQDPPPPGFEILMEDLISSGLRLPRKNTASSSPPVGTSHGGLTDFSAELGNKEYTYRRPMEDCAGDWCVETDRCILCGYRLVLCDGQNSEEPALYVCCASLARSNVRVWQCMRVVLTCDGTEHV